MEKAMEERLKESIEIHKQLTILGALVDPVNKEKLAKASNGFVHEGTSATLCLKVENAVAKVVFTRRIGRRSGVILEAEAPTSYRGR